MLVSHRERSIHNGLVRSWRNLGTVPQDEDGNLVYKPNDRTWATGEYPGRLYPTPTWETVKQLLDMTDLKTMLKGLMIAEDVERAVEVGADTVCATRHGSSDAKHLVLPPEQACKQCHN